MQEYTYGFRKMALMLYIPLHTQENITKYIGGIPAHIRNIVFMFGPTNLGVMVFCCFMPYFRSAYVYMVVMIVNVLNLHRIDLAKQ
jgi:hypothetical protein